MYKWALKKVSENKGIILDKNTNKMTDKPITMTNPEAKKKKMI